MSTLMTNPFYANHLITLREAFPDSEPEVVEDVLRSSQGDLTVAFNVMLAMSDAKQSLPSISSSSQHSVPALPRRATTGRSTGRSNLHSSRESIGHPIPPPNPPPTQLFSQLLSQLSERNHNRPIYTPLPPHLPYRASQPLVPTGTQGLGHWELISYPHSISPYPTSSLPSQPSQPPLGIASVRSLLGTGHNALIKASTIYTRLVERYHLEDQRARHRFNHPHHRPGALPHCLTPIWPNGHRHTSHPWNGQPYNEFRFPPPMPSRPSQQEQRPQNTPNGSAQTHEPSTVNTPNNPFQRPQDTFDPQESHLCHPPPAYEFHHYDQLIDPQEADRLMRSA